MSFCPALHGTDWDDWTHRHWAVWINARWKVLPVGLRIARLPSTVGLKLVLGMDTDVA